MAPSTKSVLTKFLLQNSKISKNSHFLKHFKVGSTWEIIFCLRISGILQKENHESWLTPGTVSKQNAQKMLQTLIGSQQCLCPICRIVLASLIWSRRAIDSSIPFPTICKKMEGIAELVKTCRDSPYLIFRNSKFLLKTLSCFLNACMMPRERFGFLERLFASKGVALKCRRC